MTENNVSTNKEKSCWTKYSENKLINLERKILSVLTTAYKGWFVKVGSTDDNSEKIWTIALNQESANTPLVMLHGFAAGVGFWCLNLDDVAKDRPVYAFDLLGFGRSSRPNFSNDHQEAEQEMVTAIDNWRQKLNLDKIILLGHSFGGYLATSYTINYPDHVNHLILVDPWGFLPKPSDFSLPLWIKALALPLQRFNPLATVRAVGPIGPWLIRKVRSDIAEKYSEKIGDKEVITQYIYQCNCQKPTGETAFHNMIQEYAFPKVPMITRIPELRSDIPITILYGGESWVTKCGDTIKQMRPNSYVNIEIVENAGHHIHADQPEVFNEIVMEASKISNRNVSTAATTTHLETSTSIAENSFPPDNLQAM